ncbi:MAG: small ribosomal subunit Rsm22 family protein, partial [Bdellovibrio sp.]
MALTLAFSQEEESLWSSRVRELGVRNLAARVKKLSDFYIQRPESKTPWQDSEMRSAYELYHHPLNVLRLRALWQRIPHLDLDSWSVLDFGCGLGATGASRSWDRLIEVDSAPSALGRSQICDLQEGLMRLRSLPRPWVLVLSYVYTELSAPLSWWKDFDLLVVVEPSTQEDGRRLLRLREKLRSESWWAVHPCTHQNNCPLFSASQKDWCHDRFHFQQFDLWKEFEGHLPIKNRTLTFSSLVLSR